MRTFNCKISQKFKRRVAEYYVYNNSTVRKTAEHFGISKSYVHMILVEFQIGKETSGSQLAKEVSMLIEKILQKELYVVA